MQKQYITREPLDTSLGQPIPAPGPHSGAPLNNDALLPHIQIALATERPCPRCGCLDVPSLGPGSGQHYARLRCRHCDCWLQWLSRHPAEERCARREQARLQAMAQKPPSEGQLGYLEGLGYSGPRPASMAEASERIDALRKGKQL
jgi:hypothetical protein